MPNYSISLSGLDAAQKALNVIGNNIANAATEGYHRQRIDLSPGYSSQYGSILLGGGVEVGSVTRLIDNLLEQEIYRQQSSLGQVSRELITLGTVENAFGELSGAGGLNAAIDKFFNALGDLSAHPGEVIWQDQAVSDAKAMANQFRTVAEFLTTLETQIRLEAENTIESINTLTSQIAALNANIERLEVSGAQANNLRDQRDRCISELSELVRIQTLNREYGVVDVSVAGIPVVVGGGFTALEVGLDENSKLGISISGESNYSTNIEGGKVGGLLSLKNEIVSGILEDLDTLAKTMVQQINQYHVQGVGSEGSFARLAGWSNTSGNWSDFSSISAGYVYIRVTNTSTDAITRTQITIDPNDSDHDSISDLATDISAITGLNASVDSSSNRLTITVDGNYEFDFIPAVLSVPKASDIHFNGSSKPTVSVSGIYTGSSNDTLTFTVSGTGDVGVDTLTLTVTDLASNTIDTINIGSGYAAGDMIEVGDTGVKISFSMGDLVNEDFFSIDVFADTDTSGVLSAIGLNTFFSGNNAEDIAVRSDISANPGRIATALGADMTDNVNVSRMAGVKDEAISSLNSLTCGEFYRRMVADIGQHRSLKQIRQENIEVMVQNLANQQSEISGVDINEEAAQLLIFEQMFQAMARYMNTIRSSIEDLMLMVE